jgi:hypothetical protein
MQPSCVEGVMRVMAILTSYESMLADIMAHQSCFQVTQILCAGPFAHYNRALETNAEGIVGNVLHDLATGEAAGLLPVVIGRVPQIRSRHPRASHQLPSNKISHDDALTITSRQVCIACSSIQLDTDYEHVITNVTTHNQGRSTDDNPPCLSDLSA